MLVLNGYTFLSDHLHFFFQFYYLQRSGNVKFLFFGSGLSAPLVFLCLTLYYYFFFMSDSLMCPGRSVSGLVRQGRHRWPGKCGGQGPFPFSFLFLKFFFHLFLLVGG